MPGGEPVDRQLQVAIGQSRLLLHGGRRRIRPGLLHRLFLLFLDSVFQCMVCEGLAPASIAGC